MLTVFILWMLGIFAAILLMIFLRERITKNIILISGVFSAILGVAFYGYGYFVVSASKAVGAIKAVFAVIRIFLGGNAYDDICDAPLFSFQSVQIVFWLLHFAGTFSTASAALATFGKRVFRDLRLKIDRFSPIHMIYGPSDDTLHFGQQLLENYGGHVIVVGQASEFSADLYSGANIHFKSDPDALEGTVSLLQSLGIHRGKRDFHLYCFSEDYSAARIYADRILKSLEKLNVPAHRTALTLHTPQQSIQTSLQACDKHYGYGSVDLMDVPELVSRMLIREFPLYDQISFDKNGYATENLHCVIIGFGTLGQAVLRQMIMNGQFEGSQFRADIFDISCKQRIGKFQFLYPGLLTNYDIRFHETDGRGEEFYSFFREHGRSLRYIVLCSGTEDRNDRLAREIMPCIQRCGAAVKLCLCDKHSVKGIDPNGSVHRFPIYDYRVLCTDILDRRAIMLNYRYCYGSLLSPADEWERCDFFSRSSSRASADFAEAFAKMANIDIKADGAGEWKPSAELLDNLARTEHLRWCAFHYAFGFRAMDLNVFQDRCKLYAEEVRTTGAGKTRPGKDLSEYTHVCLVPWEELDHLSKLEKELSGRDVDYCQLDRNNVLLLPELLKIEKG